MGHQFVGCHKRNMRLGMCRDEEKDADRLSDWLPEGRDLLLPVLAHMAESFANTPSPQNRSSDTPTD